MSFEPTAYGPHVATLLEAAPCNELGPGSPAKEQHGALAALTPDSLLAGQPLADRQMALAAISGLWLRFDFLDESHRISQDLQSATGSYWHGIMHRREPDFGNSKYWFRRVGQHSVFESLSGEASRLAAEDAVPEEARFLRQQANWDPFAFVDLCQAAQRSTELRTFCQKLQQCEWELLFDYCYRRAAG